jgi:hypothetical protein
MADQAASYNKVAHVHAGIGGWTTSPAAAGGHGARDTHLAPVETKARSLPLSFSAALHETSRLPGPENQLVTLFTLCLALPGHPVMRVRTSCVTRRKPLFSDR